MSWPGMKHDIEEYVRKCEVCQRNKITQKKTKLPLQIRHSLICLAKLQYGHCWTIDADLREQPILTDIPR